MSESRPPFLSLPRELRDHIYGYLLTTTFLVKVPRTEEVTSPLQLHRHTNLGILNVSRSIHEEAKRVLYRTINSTPAIANLHTIILRFGLGAACTQGYAQLGIDEFAAMHIRDFAKLHLGAPHSYFVFEFRSAFAFTYLMDSDMTSGDCKDALGQLTGFKTVVLRIRHSERESGAGLDYMISQYNAFNEDLAKALGKGEGGCDGEGYRLVYHPREW